MNKVFALLLLLFVQFTNAQSWQQQYPTFGFDINTVKILSLGEIAIGGGQETNDSIQIMFHTDDYGQTWIENEHDGLAPWNKSIAFSDPINGFGAGNDGRIIKTDDGGLHWGFAVTPVNRDWNKIVNVNAQTYYVAGGNRSNDSIQSILKTVDGGTNWLLVLDQPGPWLKSIFFTDTLNGVAVGDSGVILKTTNGGGLWAPVASPIQRDFNGITFINSNTGFIAGGDASHRTILRTDNGGTGWAVVTDTTGGILNDITFASATTGYVVGNNATVLKTTDGGLNWMPETISNTLVGNEEFRAVAFYDTSFGAIAGKQGKLFVRIPAFPFSSIQTEQVSGIDYTSAVLVGTVTGATSPLTTSFEYDTVPLLTNTVAGTPLTVNDTALHLITAQLNTLLPYQLYYYRLVVNDGTRNYKSNVQTFSTGAPAQNNTFITQTATGITPASAVLHGTIQNFYSVAPVQVSFEYGTNAQALDSTVAAGTLTITDTLPHPVTAQLTGLAVDTPMYYYRLKAVVGTNIFYGTIRQFYKGQPEIPNWDFQNWYTHTQLIPTGWYFTSDSFARVPGHTGNYALQLNGPVVATHGFPVNVLVGGSAFAARPDSFSVYIKYDIEPGDSGIVGFSLIKNGQEVVPLTLYPITGSSGGVFKRMSFNVTYNNGNMPDSIIMLFVSGNPFEDRDTIFFNTTMTIDDISFSPLTVNVTNYNFENWYSYTTEQPEHWFGGTYLIDSGNLPPEPTLSKVMHTAPGEYAMQVKTIQLKGELVNAEANTCVYAFKKTPDFAVTHRYQWLTGYYQFFPENGDSAYITIEFKKGGRFGATVGYGLLSIKQPTTAFTPFEIPVYYVTDTNGMLTMPDWANISINHNDSRAKGVSRFIIDKLRFDGFAAMDSMIVTDNEEYVNTTFEGTTLKVYPNPAGHYLYAELTGEQSAEMKLQLFSLNGQLLQQTIVASTQNKTAVNVSALAPDLYLLRLISGNTVYNQKVSIVR